MLYILCIILILSLYSLIGYLVFSQIDFAIDFSADYWGPLSTLTGAFLGAIITGIVAISVNWSDNKKKERNQNENAKKNLNIIKHYLELIVYEYRALKTYKRNFEEIDDPYEDVTFIKLDSGEEIPEYLPPAEWVEDYKRKIRPIESNIKYSSTQIIKTFEKMEQININELSIKDLDKYLNILTKFKFSQMHVLNLMKEEGHPHLENEEINEIIRLLEEL